MTGKNVTLKVRDRAAELSTQRRLPTSAFQSFFYAPASGRGLGVTSPYASGWFSLGMSAPTSVLFFTKGTTKYQYEKPAKGDNESEREEEKDKFNKKQEGAD